MKINRYSYYDKFLDFIIFIKIDDNCNLNCSFCYQGNKNNSKMDTEEKFSNCFKNLKYSIDKFLDLKSKEAYEYATLGICFFGGEPTLNPKAINRICDYLLNTYSIEERNKIFMSYTTNGIIFNDVIKQALVKMKSVNKNPVNILISSDNDKEVYDKNRKLIGSNKSGFEIVQEHIKLYKDFLFELNGKIGNNHVNVATVLATPEQMLNNPMYIQNNFKDLTRTSKLIYFFDEEAKEYIEAARKFLEKAYTNLVEKCTLNNKFYGLNDVIDGIFPLNGKETFLNECQRMATIDSSGNLNWCNHHKDFGEKIISQEEMRELTFNKKTNTDDFECKKVHNRNGALLKDKIRPRIWENLISKFDPNVPISKANIYLENHQNLYNFIKYMIGSTESEEREICIKNPTEEIKQLCEEFEIKISSKPIVSDIENVFHIDKNGNMFFDEMFKNNKEMVLTNIKEKHFMWIHTPTFLKSVNEFFLARLK